MSEVLLIKSDYGSLSPWADAFTGFDIEVRDWSAPGASGEIDYALVWKPEPGVLTGFANLKLIFSLGAGVDHLLREGVVPPGIPVIRMVDEVLTAGMTEYVLYNVLRFHRDMPQYEAARRNRIWNQHRQIRASARSVGILGLGVLGSAAASALATLGFEVAGWSRTEKHIEGIASYYGDQQLPAFLARSGILVCLLPLTAQTENILNAATLAQLPKGAFVINAARGGHCNEADLLAALDNGHITGAALDVFKTEPLEKSNPLWQHPQVYITPHIASMTLAASSTRHVIDNITRFRTGQALTHTINLGRGY